MDLHGRPRSRCSHVIFSIGSAGFLYLFLFAGVDIFRLGQSFVARFTSREAGASPRRDGTQNPQFYFQGRCWFIPTSSCTERVNWCSARFINQMHRSRSVSLLALCTLGGSQELRGVSAYPYVARFPDTSVFKDAQDVVRGIASVLLPNSMILGTFSQCCARSWAMPFGGCVWF